MELEESERIKTLTPTTYVALHRAEQLANLKRDPYTHPIMRGIWL